MHNSLKDGLYGVSLSCFDEHGGLDEEAFRKQMQYCAGRDVQGMVVCGSTSEFIYLDERDYKTSLTLAAQEIPREKVLVAGAGGPTESWVLKNMTIAADLGYCYALVCPPYYYPQKGEQILDFYRSLMENMPCGMSLILYNIPFCTASIPLEILPELLSYKNIAGMKDSSGDLLYYAKAMEIMKRTNPDVKLFTGQDLSLLACLALGGNGCMSSAAWILSELEAGIVRDLKNADLPNARKGHGKLSEIISHLDAIPFPENYRALANAKKINCGPAQRRYSVLEGENFGLWLDKLYSIMESA